MPDPKEFAEDQLKRLDSVHADAVQGWIRSRLNSTPEPRYLEIAANCIQQRTEVMALFSQPQEGGAV